MLTGRQVRQLVSVKVNWNQHDRHLTHLLYAACSSSIFTTVLSPSYDFFILMLNAENQIQILLIITDPKFKYVTLTYLTALTVINVKNKVYKNAYR